MNDVVVMAGRVRRAVVLTVAVCCAASVSACSGGTDGADPGAAGAQVDAAPSGTPEDVGPTAGAPRGAGRDAGGPSTGIGADAARSAGVFSAAYDAALRGPDRATSGRVTLRLLNTGTQADSYRITVSPSDAASMTPASTSLEPGAGAALKLRLKDDARVHVYSEGRGAEVADLPITLNNR